MIDIRNLTITECKDDNLLQDINNNVFADWFSVL